MPTRPEAVRVEFERQPGVTTVLEACTPAGWVSDSIAELGLPFIVVSTNRDAWVWKNVKRKTDRDDALQLARLASVGELQPVPAPPKPIRHERV